MEVPLSKTQIDRLGDRLKKDVHTDGDLRLLDEYCRSFGKAFQTVVQALREGGQSPTRRLPKSTLSIAEKLRRESIRLSQIQDIAGCRIVVRDVLEQDRIVAWLDRVFPGAIVVDRRDNPSHGYRAVHVIPKVSGKPVEIQVRSPLQHLWAELSEKSCDVLDSTIKYGGGPLKWRKFLTQSSEAVAAYEEFEKSHAAAYAEYDKTNSVAVETSDMAMAALESRRELKALWNVIASLLHEATAKLDDLERQKQ